jgi:hypothetical protein
VWGQHTGTHVFVRFPLIAAALAGKIAQTAAARGVRLLPADNCYAGVPQCAEFVLGYNGMRQSDIAPAIGLLRSAMTPWLPEEAPDRYAGQYSENESERVF